MNVINKKGNLLLVTVIVIAAAAATMAALSTNSFPTLAFAQQQQQTSSSSSSSSSSASLPDVFSRVENSVVQITSRVSNHNEMVIINGVPATGKSTALGSGFVYDNKGHI